jgi:VWFA-related protein
MLLFFACLGVLFTDVPGLAFQLHSSKARIRPRSSGVPKTVLRVDSSLVLIPAHVTNAAGAPVTSLKKEDFRLFEDGVEQTIANLAQDDAPVSVGVLFDASASMKGKIQKSCEAAAAFFKTANPEDEFFLVHIGERPKLSVPFTADSDQLYRAILHTKPSGRTALLDALPLAAMQMKKARNARKVLVVLSDGGDNWSRHSPGQVKHALLESDVAVYTMGIFDSDYSTKRTSEERGGPALLESLAEQTGGHHFRVDKLDDLPAITTQIGRELRSEYVLGYYSTNKSRDGKYRRVRLTTSAPKEQRLYLYYRRGYYAAAE